MWGAINLGKSAALAASARPAVRWSGLVAVAAGVLIAAFVLPKVQPKARPVAMDEAPVLAADAALGDAMRTGNRTAARRLLALQFAFVDADGKIRPRREFLGDLKSVAARSAGDIKVRNFGLLAIVTGRHKAAHDCDAFFVDIWVKQKGAWRALLMQDVPISADGEPTAAANAVHAAEPKPYECDNPCKTIRYRVRSPAEQGVVSTYQTIMKAIVAHDAGEWAKHVADEFMAYASGRAPIARSTRMASIEDQSRDDAVRVGEVQTMRLAVYGDGAVMVATDADGSHPAYRASRVFVKRDGRWLMLMSAFTDVKSQ